MRARSAQAGLPQAGTRRDRLARALSEDWERSTVIGDRAGAPHNSWSGAVLLILANEQLAERREARAPEVPNHPYVYEWRQGPLWESAYGGEG